MASDKATFVEAVEVFIAEADWLTDAETPALTALMKSAVVLDNTVSATMLAEHGKVFRYLRNLKPEAAPVQEETLEDVLETL